MRLCSSPRFLHRKTNRRAGGLRLRDDRNERAVKPETRLRTPPDRRHPQRWSTTVNCPEQIRMIRVGAGPGVAAFSDQSASSACSASTARKSMSHRSTTNTLHWRISPRARWLNSAMSTAAISSQTVIAVKPLSVLTAIGVPRRLVRVSSFRCDARARSTCLGIKLQAFTGRNAVASLKGMAGWPSPQKGN